jgi:hypothetical protein
LFPKQFITSLAPKLETILKIKMNKKNEEKNKKKQKK